MPDEQAAATGETTVAAALAATMRGNRRGDRVALKIRPWIQGGDLASVRVSPKIFHSVPAGGTICVVQRDGAMHMPWFTAQTSPWTGGTVAFGPVGRMFPALRHLIGTSPKKL